MKYGCEICEIQKESAKKSQLDGLAEKVVRMQQHPLCKDEDGEYLQTVSGSQSGILTHNMANCEIHIWLLDSFKTQDWSSLCFCGLFLNLLILVVLALYDQHLQTRGRQKQPSAFSDVYVFLSSPKAIKGKTSAKQTNFIKYFNLQKQRLILSNIGMQPP